MTTIEIFKAKRGTAWHMKRCGRITADCGKPYSGHAKCVHAVSHMVKDFVAGKFRIVDRTKRAVVICAALMLLFVGMSCKTPSLESGGVYAPTNQVGQVIYNDLGLALADASYQFAYSTVLAPLRFERDNRVMIFAANPQVGLSVKHAMDRVREQVWMVDVRWATARKAYRASPTPAGLTALQTILAEIQRIIPAVQSQLDPVYQVIVKPSTP